MKIGFCHFPCFAKSDRICVLCVIFSLCVGVKHKEYAFESCNIYLNPSIFFDLHGSRKAKLDWEDVQADLSHTAFILINTPSLINARPTFYGKIYPNIIKNSFRALNTLFICPHFVS